MAIPAENPLLSVYYGAQPARGSEGVRVETHENFSVWRRPVRLHVEIYNPTGRYPVILTPGGQRGCSELRGFARSLAAAWGELQVIIYDRRNMGNAGVGFGERPLAEEEAEDLHVLIERLGVRPATLYGSSSGARNHLMLADRYPEDVAALLLAPPTGGELAAAGLASQYYLRYVKGFTGMQQVAESPYWSTYLARNPGEREKLLKTKPEEFLAAMTRSAEHLLSFKDATLLGLSDKQLHALKVPTLVIHHGRLLDKIHSLETAKAAQAAIPGAEFGIAGTFDAVVGLLLPFVRKHVRPLVAIKEHEVDLHRAPGLRLHVEEMNPQGKYPVVITPGGQNGASGQMWATTTRGFARSLAAFSSELRVIIHDRRNMGRSGIAWGTEPLGIEEAEDMHEMLNTIGATPATLYGCSSGARTHLLLATKHPGDVAALFLAPPTGGVFAAETLSEMYYLTHVRDFDTRGMMRGVAESAHWRRYCAMNGPPGRDALLRTPPTDFLAAMRRSAEHLQSFKHATLLGITDTDLAGVRAPTMVLHHGGKWDRTHSLETARRARALIPGAGFVLQDNSGGPHTFDQSNFVAMLPFIRKNGGPARARL